MAEEVEDISTANSIKCGKEKLEKSKETIEDEVIDFKHNVKVDMIEADCKEPLLMTIEKADTTDDSLWVGVYDDFCRKIGTKLKDTNWEASFGVYEEITNIGIRKWDDFVKVFDQFKNVRIIHFKLTV